MSESTAQPYLLKFWYRPSVAIRGLLQAKQGHNLAVVSALIFGAMQALPVYLSREEVSPLILVFGAVVGLFGLYLFSWLLRNFGRWFGAQADLFEMRIALGWGLMPWALLFAVLGVVVSSGVSVEVQGIVKIVSFVGLLYGYVLILLSIAAALKLTVLKAFLCLIVTCVVSLFPLTLLAQLVAQVFGVTPAGS
ncbi:MAG: YIP1 family protein [Opitutaceae bacterium]